MNIIIYGPAQSGKTTLMSKLIKSNPDGRFSVVLDGVESFGAENGNAILEAIPARANFILCTQNLQNVPQCVKDRAVLLDVLSIRR